MQCAWATGTSRALLASNTVGQPAIQAVSKTQKAHGIKTTNSSHYTFTLIQKQFAHLMAAVQMANWTVQLKRLNTHHSDWLHIKDPSVGSTMLVTTTPSMRWYLSQFNSGMSSSRPTIQRGRQVTACRYYCSWLLRPIKPHQSGISPDRRQAQTC